MQRNSRVREDRFTAYLDLRQAFPRTFLPMALVLLWRSGIDHRTWRLVYNLLSRQFTRIQVGEARGASYTVHGLREGSPLSPRIFVVAINGVFEAARTQRIGVSVLATTSVNTYSVSLEQNRLGVTLEDTGGPPRVLDVETAGRACAAGVRVGDLLVRIGARDCKGTPFTRTVQELTVIPRPVQLMFQRPASRVEVWLGIIGFMDDLAAVGASPEELQALLDVISAFAKRHLMSFGTDKSKVVPSPWQSTWTAIAWRFWGWSSKRRRFESTIGEAPAMKHLSLWHSADRGWGALQRAMRAKLDNMASSLSAGGVGAFGSGGRAERLLASACLGPAVFCDVEVAASMVHGSSPSQSGAARLDRACKAVAQGVVGAARAPRAGVMCFTAIPFPKQEVLVRLARWIGRVLNAPAHYHARLIVLDKSLLGPKFRAVAAEAVALANLEPYYYGTCALPGKTSHKRLIRKHLLPALEEQRIEALGELHDSGIASCAAMWRQSVDKPIIPDRVGSAAAYAVTRVFLVGAAPCATNTNASAGVRQDGRCRHCHARDGVLHVLGQCADTRAVSARRDYMRLACSAGRSFPGDVWGVAEVARLFVDVDDDSRTVNVDGTEVSLGVATSEYLAGQYLRAFGLVHELRVPGRL